MRFAAVVAAAAVCSFTLAATPTATIDPSGYFKIDMTRQPTPVYVVNLPDVQAVEVANLPLDDDGAVRVTSTPAKHMVWYELLTEPLDVPGYGYVTVPAIVNTDGFSTIGVGPQLSAFSVELLSRWAPDEDFTPVGDARIGVTAFGPVGCGSQGTPRLVCPGTGGDVQVVVYNRYANTNTLTSLRVYLFP